MKKCSLFMISVLLSFTAALSSQAVSTKTIRSSSVVIAMPTSLQSSQSSLKKRAYDIGYKHGMRYHLVDLNYLLKDNEKRLKDHYMKEACYGNGKNENFLPKECWNDKELYKEYKRGFLKGYEDANNAL